MACRESRGIIILLCSGLLAFVQSQTEKSHRHHGRLLIGQSLQQDAKLNGTNTTGDILDFETDYQADMGWWHNKQLNEQGDEQKPDIAAIQHVLKLDPKVECTGDSMKLLVHHATSTPASLLFVDRGGHLSPLSLSKLPSSCGYTIRSTRTDLVLTAPYDGCFVILEEDGYVLPLRWWGLPVRMSCPLMRHLSSNPPMVTCHAGGMVVKIDWTNTASKIKVNVNGNWEPLLKASQRCVFGIVEHPEGVVISVHYTPCLETKDGLYTLELAAEGQTKISCPSLLSAQPEPAKGFQMQTENSSKGLYSTATSDSTLTRALDQTAPQGPGFLMYPQIPDKQSQVPKEVSYSKFPYYHFLQNFLYGRLASPDSVSTAQPMSPTPTPPVSQTMDERTEQSFFSFPFDSQSPLPGAPSTQPPVTKSPAGKYEEHLHQNPLNLPPGFLQKPPASQPRDKERPHHPFLFCTHPPASEAHNLHPLCFEMVPEKPGLLHPTLSENPHGDFYHTFFPFYNQPEPTPKPAGVPQPSKPGTSQGGGYHTFFPFYNQPEPTPKPAGVPQPPKPGTSQGGGYHTFFPFYNQPEPTPKPAGVPQPPKPGTSQGGGYHTFFPFYNQPEPTPKPVGVPQPSKPGTSQGGGYHTFFPFYNQPEPTPKPAGVPQPSKPGTSQGGGYHTFFPFYNQPEPTPKPVGVPQPSKPGTPQGGGYHTFFPFYNQPEPTPKPAGVPQPSKPGTSQGGGYHTFFPFYNQPEPTPKPAGVPQPSKPGTSQGGGYHTFFPFYPQPKPGTQQGSKPSAPQPAQPETHQDQFPQQMCLYSQLVANMPTAAPVPASENSQGQVYQPCQLHAIPGTGTNAGTPVEKPGQSSQPPIKPPQSHIHNPFNLFYYSHQPQYFTPVSTVQQQVSALANDQKIPDSPITQTGNVGIPLQVPQSSSPHMPSVYCPHFCPSGFSNCCLQIAFHQHFNFVPTGFDKDAAQFYPGLPFLSSVVYDDFGSGLEFAPFLQKLTEAATLQTATAFTSAQSTPLLPLVADKEQPYIQPQDGNPVAPPGSGPSNTGNLQMPIYPYSLTDSLHPHLSYMPQYLELLNMQQDKSAADSNLSQLRASGDKPVVQYEPYNIWFPKQSNQPIGETNPSRPNLISNQYIQRTSEQQSKPTANVHQSLDKRFGDYKGEIDTYLSSYHMPQDAPVPTHNDSVAHNNSQEFETGSSEHEQTLSSHSDSQRYLLLPYGPPGREHNSFTDSPVPLRDLVHTAKSETVTLGRHTNPQNLKHLQEKGQQIKWLGEVMSIPLLGNANYMQRLDESGLPSFSTSTDEPHQMYLPSEQSFSATHLKPEANKAFEDPWKSLTPTDSVQKFPLHIPGKVFQQWSSDQPENGMNRPLLMEQGNQKEK